MSLLRAPQSPKTLHLRGSMSYSKASQTSADMKQAILTSMSISNNETRAITLSATIRTLVENVQLSVGVLRTIDTEKVTEIMQEMESNVDCINQLPWGGFLPESVDCNQLNDESSLTGRSLALFEGNHRLQSILQNTDVDLKERALSLKVRLNIRLVPKDIFDQIVSTGKSVYTDWADELSSPKNIPEEVVPYLREAHVSESIRLEDSRFREFEEFPLTSYFVRQAHSKIENSKAHLSRTYITNFVNTLITMKEIPKSAKMAAWLSFCPSSMDDLLVRLMKTKSTALNHEHSWFNVVTLGRYDVQGATDFITKSMLENYDNEMFSKTVKEEASIAQHNYTVMVTPPEILEKTTNATERQRKRRASMKLETLLEGKEGCCVPPKRHLLEFRSDSYADNREMIRGKVIVIDEDDLNSLYAKIKKQAYYCCDSVHASAGYILPLKDAETAAISSFKIMKILRKFPTYIGLINDQMHICGSTRDENFLCGMEDAERIDTLHSATPVKFKFETVEYPKTFRTRMTIFDYSKFR